MFRKGIHSEVVLNEHLEKMLFTELSVRQVVRRFFRGRIIQSKCTFPHFLIGFVLPLLLPTPAIWFSLDHKRNVSDGVVRGIGTLFSLDYKLCASDYDSDSVASENQPLKILRDRSLFTGGEGYYFFEKWLKKKNDPPLQHDKKNYDPPPTKGEKNCDPPPIPFFFIFI